MGDCAESDKPQASSNIPDQNTLTDNKNPSVIGPRSSSCNAAFLTMTAQSSATDIHRKDMDLTETGTARPCMPKDLDHKMQVCTTEFTSKHYLCKRIMHQPIFIACDLA